MAKKGSGSSKKKGKKKGKKAQDVLSFEEVKLAYLINILEKEVEDYYYDMKAEEEKLERCKERHERLKVEHNTYLEELLNASREFEKKQAQLPETTKCDVVKEMQENWVLKKKEEANLKEFKRKIVRKEREIKLAKKEIRHWQKYKDEGLLEHRKVVETYEKEIEEIQLTFEEIAEHMKKTIGQDMRNIVQTSDEACAIQKDIASEKALEQLDQDSCLEVAENGWLKKEYELHSRKSARLAEETETLEAENLQIMNKLYTYREDDLRVSKKAFLTQFPENDLLDLENDVIGMDLERLSCSELPSGRSARIEDFTDSRNFEIENISCKPIDYFESLDSKNDSSDFLSEKDYEEDILKRGSLELQLLRVCGKKKPTHLFPAFDEEMGDALALRDEDENSWKLTRTMVKSLH